MAKNSMDLLELLPKRGMDGDVDFLRGALPVLMEGIMDAEVSAQIVAQRGERHPDRVTHRNGYPNRPWDTRVGTMALRIPKIRKGSYFKGSYFQSLLEAGRRSQKALLSVVQQACVEAVSTRRVDGLTNAMGCDGISKVRCLASVETYTRWWRISGPTRERRSSSLCMGGRVTPEGWRRWSHRYRQRGDGSRRCLATVPHCLHTTLTRGCASLRQPDVGPAPRALSHGRSDERVACG